jgi:hypothetical protein
VIILDWEIEEAKKLILEDVEGNLLCQQLLIIDASGLTQSIRKKRDGHTFFGPVETYVIIFLIRKTQS